MRVRVKNGPESPWQNTRMQIVVLGSFLRRHDLTNDFDLSIISPNLRIFTFHPSFSITNRMLFGISFLVLVIIIVLLALISGQEPIPVGQEADARRRR